MVRSIRLLPIGNEGGVDLGFFVTQNREKNHEITVGQGLALSCSPRARRMRDVRIPLLHREEILSGVLDLAADSSLRALLKPILGRKLRRAIRGDYSILSL